MLSESEFVLKEALSIYQSQCGEVSVEVADTLACLSSTYNDRGTYNEGRYLHVYVLCVNVLSHVLHVHVYKYMYKYIWPRVS